MTGASYRNGASVLSPRAALSGRPECRRPSASSTPRWLERSFIFAESSNGVSCLYRAASEAAPDPLKFVLEYIEAAQRARTTQSPDDLDRLRTFLAADVVIKMVSPWTDSPWRVVSTSADQLVERFADPINGGLEAGDRHRPRGHGRARRAHRAGLYNQSRRPRVRQHRLSHLQP